MLERLRLQNFRSFEDRSFNFNQKTLVLGANGSGKSTVIEAIRLLSVNKSFRTSRLDETTYFDKRFWRLIGDFRANNEARRVEFFYGMPFEQEDAKQRSLLVNGKVTNLLDYVGQEPSVLFVPDDVEVVLGAPNLRRRYIDGVLWQTSVEFRQNYLEFQRILKERSRLLFMLKIKRAGLDELKPWNELLERLSEALRADRAAYVAYVMSKLGTIKNFDATGLELELSYQPEVPVIEAVVEEEIRLGQNLFGPHRDEIVFKINGRLARQYASRGQARTFIAVLKIIEVFYLKELLGVSPVILLDDIFSELDQVNTNFLFENLINDWQIIASALTRPPNLADFDMVKL